MFQTSNKLYSFETLAPEARTALETYADQLLKWNKKMNLSGAHSREELYSLFTDSFALASVLEHLFPAINSDCLICDLGAGAGLPGIPLRTIWDKGNYIMVEAREKRALFLVNTLARLRLAHTSVYNGRAENFFAGLGRFADCIISRAFMPWEKLLSFCKPWLNKSGILMIMANSPLPDLPDSWVFRREFPYQANGKNRWLWALGLIVHES